jgi:succinoglycan biosynthesis protein ExoM
MTSSFQPSWHAKDRGPAIGVCICSYRRPEIADTLAALARQTAPPGSFRVIVADNTAEAAMRDLVHRLRDELSLPLLYLHAPSDNISLARNACLEAATTEWIAFVDDDERPVENWLAALMEEAQRARWDAVLGPVLAIYDGQAPEWLRRANLHSTTPVWRNGSIASGYAGNVLFRRDLAVRHGLRFRLDLGVTGGEDDDFFDRFREAGGTIGYAPKAVCFENVSPARASLTWVLRRRFRAGRSHGLRLRQQSHPGVAVLVAGAKAIYCAANTAWSFSNSTNRNRHLARGALHAGVVSEVLTPRAVRRRRTADLPSG